MAVRPTLITAKTTRMEEVEAFTPTPTIPTTTMPVATDTVATVAAIQDTPAWAPMQKATPAEGIAIESASLKALVGDTPMDIRSDLTAIATAMEEEAACASTTTAATETIISASIVRRVGVGVGISALMAGRVVVITARAGGVMGMGMGIALIVISGGEVIEVGGWRRAR